MKTFIWIAIVTACQALTPPHITGTTPPAVSCPNSLCDGKNNGNYEYFENGKYNPHYFVQCFNGLVHCQACWPLQLEFSQNCNQCLYSKNDKCVTTKKWQPATTFDCPDLCHYFGPFFSGNIADPDNQHQYVACWEGTTVGCIACPKGLLYNEEWNACLYDGVYKTQPDSSVSNINNNNNNNIIKEEKSFEKVTIAKKLEDLQIMKVSEEREKIDSIENFNKINGTTTTTTNDRVLEKGI